MNFRALKSLTFFIGLILFIGAFIALILAGNLFNPAPYHIVVAKKDIPAYSTLTPDMLAVDEQTMNPRIAKQLIHEKEIDRFIGGTVVEPIHAGEPLRLMAIVTANSPGAASRLSLALDDPTKVAMVIPVTPDIIPDNVLAGDYVNIQLGVGQVPQQYGDYGGASIDTANKETVSMPFAKIVLQNIPVLQVYHEQVPNPNYGTGFGDQSQNEPPYIDGDLQRITVLVPQEAQEMLAFAIENGALRLSLVPLVAVKNNLPQPTDGVTWDDFLAFFKAQREARQTMVSVTPQTPSLSNRDVVSGTTPITETNTLSPTTVITPAISSSNTGASKNAVARENADTNNAVTSASSDNAQGPAKPAAISAHYATSINLADLVLPGALCLVALVVLIGGVYMLKAARKKNKTAV